MFDSLLSDLLSDDLDLVFPLPGRVPSLADVACYEAEAIAVSHLQARIIARELATVRPGASS